MAHQFNNEDPSFLASVTHHAPEAMMVLNNELQVIYVNQVFEKMTGFTCSDIKESGLCCFFGDYDNLESHLRKAFSKPMRDFETKGCKKTQQEFPLEISASRVELYGNQHLCLIVKNISKRKKLAKTLELGYDRYAETNTKLEKLLNTVEQQKKQLQEYNKKIQNELQVAIGVQKALVPKDFSGGDFLDIHGMSIPCSDLGGDYLDIFHLGNKRLGFLVCDVSGHGVASALIATMAKAIFTSYVHDFDSPDKFMRAVNSKLFEILFDSPFYMTAVYSILDLRNLEVLTTCAGHEPPVYYNAKTDTLTSLGKTDMSGSLLGCLEDKLVEFNVSADNLEPGSRLLYFSDGITEARNIDGDFFGSDRLEQFVISYNHLAAQDFSEKLISTLDTFYNGRRANDDRTLINIKMLDNL